MSETRRNIMVAITMIVALAGVVYLVAIFGELPRWFRPTYAVQIELDSANGLGEGSRVTLQGLTIGQIETIGLREDPADGVIATCQVREQFDIPKNAIVRARTGLFGGGAVLAITVDPEAPTTEYVAKDGSGKLMGRAASVVDQIDRSLRRLGTAVDSFQDMSESISGLADRYTRLGDDVENLITQRAPEAVDAGDVPANITTIAARMDATIKEARTMIGKAERSVNAFEKIVTDEKLQADIRGSLADIRDASADAKAFAKDAREVAGEAKTMTADAREVLKKTDERLAALSRRYYAVADDMSKLLDEAERLVKDARTGDGTAAKLLQDPKLYNNLNDTATTLSDTLKEMQLLIQKWKAEGLPVQF